MSSYVKILNLFKKHPQSTTSITALILEIALSEVNEEEVTRILNFAKGNRTQSDNDHLLEDVQSYQLLKQEDLTEPEVSAIKRSAPERSVDMANFSGTSEEAKHIAAFFGKRVVVPATHWAEPCKKVSDETKPISGRFVQSGRAYETTYLHEVTEECPDTDIFGYPLGGASYHTSQYETTTITWRDGDPNSRPPTTPPIYDGNATWDNERCRLFSAGSQHPISSDFGWRQIGKPPRSNFHEGVDIAVGEGVEVYATTGGTITDIDTTAAKGNRFVVIKNGTIGYKYLHIDPAVGIIVGLPVKSGEYVGNISGDTPHIHLHYSVHENPSNFTNVDMRDANATDPCP